MIRRRTTNTMGAGLLNQRPRARSTISRALQGFVNVQIARILAVQPIRHPREVFGDTIERSPYSFWHFEISGLNQPLPRGDVFKIAHSELWRNQFCSSR
jgi:hypothetical protein